MAYWWVVPEVVKNKPGKGFWVQRPDNDNGTWPEEALQGFRPNQLVLEGPYEGISFEREKRHKVVLHSVVYLVVALAKHTYGTSKKDELIKRGLVPKLPRSQWKGQKPIYNWSKVTSDFLLDKAPDLAEHVSTAPETLAVEVDLVDLVECVLHLEDEYDGHVLQIFSSDDQDEAAAMAWEWAQYAEEEMKKSIATGKLWEDIVREARMEDETAFYRADLRDG